MVFYKRKLHIIFTALAVFCLFHSNAQEQIRPLGMNLNLTQQPTNIKTANKTTNTAALVLPFFDDFSYGYRTPFPSENNWLDSNVYVNTGFAIAPLTIGVATFDGLNKKGYPYILTAPVSNSGQADYLTSKAINLAGKIPADSLYLSFYYQAEGNGDSPEPSDSLCLDFRKANQSKWQKVWGMKGYNPSATDTNFHKVFISIKDTAYLNGAFQFRFRNRATLSGSLDHWNLDYVKLDANRSLIDTTIQDMAFAYRSTSFLKNYWAMPYRQYNTLEMASSLKNFMRNNYSTASSVVYEYFVYDELGVQVHHYDGLTNNMDPYYPTGYHNKPTHSNPIFTYVVPTPTAATYYTVKHNIHKPTSGQLDDVSENDTLLQLQKLSDYYAYDDGSAEGAYYLNFYGAKTAVRYTLNVDDTLRAMRVYFDPVVDGAIIQSSTFRLCVWDGSSGSPGSLIYMDSVMNPKYEAGCYNLIPTYNLTSCLRLTAGTYYFGVQQTTNQPLNIGFDKNTNHIGSLYYDIGNGWTQSAIKGSIMINPVMGCALPTGTMNCSEQVVGIDEQEKENEDLVLFPNPAQSMFTIKVPDNNFNNAMVEIYSALGENVKSVTFENNQPIDISTLPNGIYVVYLNSKEKNVTPKKLIISR